jgi:hypothetical protein
VAGNSYLLFFNSKPLALSGFSFPYLSLYCSTNCCEKGTDLEKSQSQERRPHSSFHIKQPAGCCSTSYIAAYNSYKCDTEMLFENTLPVSLYVLPLSLSHFLRHRSGDSIECGFSHNFLRAKRYATTPYSTIIRSYLK